MKGRKLTFRILLWLTLLFQGSIVRASTNGLALLPPMGYNSWYANGSSVDQHLITNTASIMATNGMKAAGYQYINLDDGWASFRDTNGVIVPDTNKFPNGMQWLCDYVHALGFKIGIYTTAGSNTCADYAGSFDHIDQDAKTYAGWGIDYLKFEGCGAGSGDIQSRQQIYLVRMQRALANSGRPILFTSSTYNVENWMPRYLNSWRATGDIDRGWNTILHHIDVVAQTPSLAGPGAWNDADVLPIGSGFFGYTEYQSIFSMWCMLNSPLLVEVPGNPTLTNFLQNAEAIAVDQDPAGIPAVCVSSNNNLQVWARPLGGTNTGSFAVTLFNRDTNTTNITAKWSDIGLPPGVATVRDMWARAFAGTFTNSYTASIPGHGSQMLKLVAGATLPRPPVGTDYLSHLNWLSDETTSTILVTGAPIGIDISGAVAPMKLRGVVYTNGLGMLAFTHVSYFLGAAASNFQATIGVDDIAGIFGTVIFRVYADGTKIYDSGVLSTNSPAINLNLDLTGVYVLTLEASDPIPGGANAYADWANAQITMLPLPPTVPAGFALTSATTNNFTLFWYPSFGATSYNLKRSTVPGGPYTIITNLSAPGFTDNSLAVNATYYYVVSAVNAFGESANSAEISGSLPLYWVNALTDSPQDWDLNLNWTNTIVFPNTVGALAVINNNIQSDQLINLNEDITIGALVIGAVGGSASYLIADNGGSLTFDNDRGYLSLTQLASSAGDTLDAPTTLTGDFGLINNSTNVLTLAGPIASFGVITQTGIGPILLGGSNSFAQAYILGQGELIIGNNTALGNTEGAATISNTTTLDVNGFNLGSQSIVVSGVGFDGHGAVISSASTSQTNALQFVTLNGDTTFGGSARWDIRGATNTASLSTSGNPFNLTKTGMNQISLASVNIDPALGDINVQQGTLSFEAATSSLGNPVNTLTVEAGASLSFIQTTTPWDKMFSLNGDGVTPGIISGSGSNTVIGSITLNNDSTFAVTSGTLALNGPIAGPGGIIKTLGGQLFLGGTNTFAGNVSVNAGSLAIFNTNALANCPLISLAANTFMDTRPVDPGLNLLASQTLSGSGAVIGNLEVNSNAVLAPANSFSTLTFDNALALDPGSATIMETSPSPLTNDLVRVLGTLNYGGNLILTNLTSSPYIAGNSFKLFDAAAYVGAFKHILPQIPGPSLVWDPSALGTTGTVRVVAGSTPRFTSHAVLGVNLLFAGSGGVPNGTYYIISSTNLAILEDQWPRIATNQFDGSGNFTYTNSVDPSAPPTYFALQLPQ